MEDFLSEKYLRRQELEKRRPGKRIKLDDGDDGMEEEDKEDEESAGKDLLSPFEKKATNGRWILEQKHQFYQSGSPVSRTFNE